MTPSPRSHYVPSLDGLRTIAVGLVIAFHINFPHLASGFAGVDVFFVLSGFLITQGLVRDVETEGRPRFARFWQRRFKRLLPAVTLAYLAVLVYVICVMPVVQRTKAAGDLIATALYVANWHFMGANSYFSSDGQPALLLHMWSLAVEEQFYLVWPLLIGLVAWLVTRRGGVSRGRVLGVLGWVIVVGAAASAVWLAVSYAPTSTDRAYMGTDTKAFELLIGAGGAIAVSRDRSRDLIFRARRVVIPVAALGGVALLHWLTGPSEFYFRGGALLLSLLVAALIATLAVTVDTPGWLARALSLPPIVYLGKISYGLYVWHWPWAVWLGVADTGRYHDLRGPAVLALTLACASFSYHFVETPIRSGRLSGWLTPWKTLISALVTMAVIASGSGWVYFTHGIIGGANFVLVVGDSVPSRFSMALDTAARRDGWYLSSASRGGCSPLAIEQQEYLKPNHRSSTDCRQMAELQSDALRLDRPKIVFWWSRYEINQRWDNGTLLTPNQPEFWQAQHRDLLAAVDRLTATGATLVIGQTERPGTGMTTRCTPEDCHPLLDLMTNHDEYRRHWNQMVRELAASDPRVRTFDLDPIICKDPEPAQPTGYGLCHDNSTNGLLRPDGSHFGPGHQDIADRIMTDVLAAAR